MQPYGGFWLRFVAYVIDAVVLNIAMSAFGLFVGFGIGAGLAAADNGDAAAGIASLVGGAMGLVGSWLYSAVLESSSWQATLGKKALGLVVTDERGERIGFGRATGRYFAKILSALILLFGFFMIGWTQRRQGLHDIVAGTLVWKAGAPELVRTDASVFE